MITETREIEVLIKELSKKTGRSFSVSSRELWEYLHAESYEDDLFTLNDVLSSDYLLLHELVEIECLKEKGLEITSRVTVENPEVVYRCHLDALRAELLMALQENDTEWVWKRLRDAESYLEDKNLPSELREEVVEILVKFGREVDDH
ncbi:hypothetical protein [Thermococcus sp.]